MGYMIRPKEGQIGLKTKLKCAYRFSAPPANAYSDFGFRVVRRAAP
jgi:formylglycine-generating enzyme required for sulfatase activity